MPESRRSVVTEELKILNGDRVICALSKLNHVLSRWRSSGNKRSFLDIMRGVLHQQPTITTVYIIFWIND